LMAKGKSVERQLLHLWWHFTLGRSMSLKVDQQSNDQKKDHKMMNRSF
jgi:hypothetical protein